MRIQTLTAYEVPIALRKPVRHASHVRHSNQTLIIRCQLVDGSVGWGEGLPRTYVTGDSIDSAWRHLASTDFTQLTDSDFQDAHSAAATVDQLTLSSVQPDPGVSVRECFGNPVRSAIEIALLDAIGKSLGTSVGDLVAAFPESAAVKDKVDTVRYGGAITSDKASKQWLSALKMKVFGFHQIKVKVGTAGIDDTACLTRIRTVVGQRVDLRLDANEAWEPDQVVARMQPLMPFATTCLEQPVPHAEVAALAGVRNDLQIPVMLDESLCCEEDAHLAIDGEWCDFFNIRLSKCGGFLRSIRLAAMAKSAGLGFQLGCQVGETGILSAAGRHFVCNIKGARYLEGSYDRFLVRERLTAEDLTFRYGGRAARLNKPGLGITISDRHIDQIAVRHLKLV
jgi:L-Ala-D/L-Glu epimerase / N-acetyl-D-glutamate racemase